MVFLKEVEALQQHKQQIERNNAELERENKELKKELQERSKRSPHLEPFSNETEEQNIEQQVHSVTQSAQVKPYSTQDTLDFVHTVTQATNRKPTPPSKYRRIKEKTSQGTRKLNVDPIYTYPLLDKRADEEMKMQTDGPTDQKKLKKLNNHHMQVLKLLPQPTLQLIKDMWANTSPNNVAYTGPNSFVMVEDIQEILRDGELGYEIINTYAQLLLEEYDNLPNFCLIESQQKRSYIFSTDLMRLAITKYICSEMRVSRLEHFSSTACMCPTPKQQPNSDKKVMDAEDAQTEEDATRTDPNMNQLPLFTSPLTPLFSPHSHKALGSKHVRRPLNAAAGVQNSGDNDAMMAHLAEHKDIEALQQAKSRNAAAHARFGGASEMLQDMGEGDEDMERRHAGEDRTRATRAKKKKKLYTPPNPPLLNPSNLWLIRLD
ncbi:hypothetical protein RHMOL_Rhmol02G0310400 [Rhododendron molle]|uniref:Uncharacterized protein n=1 Tax=Rhododendron molle TaxID=49168 RepID=A0ACC0PWK5_RHOML|nr:hypothetical protein RHMOL_Rhmol02G0310400 [Rhododendron molle]